MSAKRIGVIFGGRSVEHEISVVTAHQVMAALTGEYEVIPLYITKEGHWYCGDALKELRRFWQLEGLLRDARQCIPEMEYAGRQMWFTETQHGPFSRGRRFSIDLAFPMMHGHGGEDGTLQGMLELVGVPYAGPNMTAAALCMDKVLTKAVLRSHSIPVLDHVEVVRPRFAEAGAGVINEIESRFNYPLFVKPRSLGSSIGVSPVSGPGELSQALELALSFDYRALAEPSLPGIVEINCAVLGDRRGARASLCEQLTKSGFVSYQDKYAGGGKSKSEGMKSADRIIPAPISEEMTAAIQTTAVQAFNAVDGSGVARIDFLVNQESGEYYVNEINSIPGSLAFYLWQPMGIDFTELLRTLMEIAQRRQADEAQSVRSFERWILSAPSSKA